MTKAKAKPTPTWLTELDATAMRLYPSRRRLGIGRSAKALEILNYIHVRGGRCSSRELANMLGGAPFSAPRERVRHLIAALVRAHVLRVSPRAVEFITYEDAAKTAQEAFGDGPAVPPPEPQGRNCACSGAGKAVARGADTHPSVERLRRIVASTMDGLHGCVVAVEPRVRLGLGDAQRILKLLEQIGREA